MIKFTAHGGERNILGIGLSKANCEKLLAGESIVIYAEEMNENSFNQIVLLAGETEQTMYNDLKQKGLLDGVPIHDDRDRKRN